MYCLVRVILTAALDEIRYKLEILLFFCCFDIFIPKLYSFSWSEKIGHYFQPKEISKERACRSARTGVVVSISMRHYQATQSQLVTTNRTVTVDSGGRKKKMIPSGNGGNYLLFSGKKYVQEKKNREKKIVLVSTVTNYWSKFLERIIFGILFSDVVLLDVGRAMDYCYHRAA